MRKLLLAAGILASLACSVNAQTTLGSSGATVNIASLFNFTGGVQASGNTITFPATAANLGYQVGSWTSGDCLAASGTLGGIADAGTGACGSGGGSGTVNSGTINGLGYYAATGTAISALATANSSVLVTNGSGVPGWGTTLPSVLTIPTATISNPTLTGTVTSSQYVATAGAVTLTGTGSTTETNLAALTIPGGAMGTNGQVQVNCLFSRPTSQTDAATVQFRFNPTSGSTFGGPAGTASIPAADSAAQTLMIVSNNNSASAQVLFSGNPTAPFGAQVAAIGTLTVNTGSATYINVNGTLGITSDTLILEHCQMIVVHS